MLHSASVWRLVLYFGAFVIVMLGAQAIAVRSWRPARLLRRQVASSVGCLSLATDTIPEPQDRKLLKRKVALVVGYVGSGFYGLQMQMANATPDGSLPTIENELRLALIDCGLVLPSNGHDLSRIDWSRSSRTDKGVHAARIVLSAKLELDPALVEENKLEQLNRFPALVKAINDRLPPSIRVFSCTRMPSAFAARGDGKWRGYHYLLPLRLLRPGAFLDGGDRNEAPISREEADALLQRLNEQLAQYEGPNSFHNFHRLSPRDLGQRGKPRRGPEPAEPVAVEEAAEEGFTSESAESSDRATAESDRPLFRRHYDDSWRETPRATPEVAQSVVYRCRASLVDAGDESPRDFGERMVRIDVVGKSFLLHQIRLMISGAVLVTREVLPESFLPLALTLPIHFPLPLAPAEGLVLSSTAFAFRPPQLSELPLYRKLNSLQRLRLSQLVRSLDCPLSPAQAALSDELPLSRLSGEWRPATPREGGVGCLSLMTRDELRASDEFFERSIVPTTLSDWAAKTVRCRATGAERLLAAEYAQQMERFRPSASTLAAWAPLVQRAEEQRRGNAAFRSQRDAERLARGVSKARAAVVEALATGAVADFDAALRRFQFPRHFDFASAGPALQQLNAALYAATKPQELQRLRASWPHRHLLPASLPSRLTLHFQLYPGLVQTALLRLLATRAVFCGDEAELARLFGSCERVIAMLERELDATEPACPDDDPVARRRRLVSWLQKTLGWANCPDEAAASGATGSDEVWFHSLAATNEDSCILCFLD